MRTKLACSPTRGTHRPLITPSTPNKLYITPQLPTPSLFVSFSNHFHHYQKLNYKSLLLPRLSCFLFTKFSLNTHLRKSMSAGIFSASVARSGYVGLKANSSQLFPVKDSISWTRKTISNGSKTHCMKTWNPIDNKKFETLSYLPPLTDESIAKEIDYMLKKGWIPCLEFDAVGHVYRENSRIPGYYDGRYWTLWKLPMFGCNDSSPVLHEIHECKKAYPNAYIRCLAFDNKHQGQCMAFVIQKPTTPF